MSEELNEEQEECLLAAGFRALRLKAGTTGPWLWERGGRIWSAEAALELVEGEELYRALFGDRGD